MQAQRPTFTLLAALGALALVGCNEPAQQEATRSDQAETAKEPEAMPKKPEEAESPAPATEAETAKEPEAMPKKPEEAEAPAPAKEAETAEKPKESAAARSEAEMAEQGMSGKKAAQSLGCSACHAPDMQVIGPSFQAVAKRYDHDSDQILERIKMAVNDGASGQWSETTGGAPMPPQPQAQGKDKQLKAIADWIAGMGM